MRYFAKELGYEEEVDFWGLCGLVSEVWYDGENRSVTEYDQYGNVVQSKSAVIAQPVQITKQPVDVCVKNGATASVKVVAKGEGLTYRWYFKNAGASDYTYTASYTGNTYSVTMTNARAGRRVLCRVYDKYGNVVQSKSVVLAHPSEKPATPTGVEVTIQSDDVNLRNGAGTEYDVIGQANTGDTLVITEVKTVQGLLWGKFDGGWVALKYTNYEDLVDEPAPPEEPVGNRTSEDGLEFIKKVEGFSAKPYRDTDGHYTIGYGTWCDSDKVSYYMNNPMSKEEADRALRETVRKLEIEVNKLEEKNGITFTQQQYDAVISLIFNCGVNSLRTGDTLIQALTMEEVDENHLLYAFSIYSMSGGKRSLGHVKRRLLEAKIYLYGDYSMTVPENIGYVIYEACGGEIVSGNGTYNVQGYCTDTPADPMSATREGYIFKGWFTQKEGGKQVTKLDRDVRNAYLYAQWEKDPDYEGELPEEPEKPEEPEEPEIPELPENHGFVVPTKAKEITPVLVRMTSNGVNMRQGPGTKYDRTRVAYNTDSFYVYATYKTTNYTWGLSKYGWVVLYYTNYDYVTAEKPEKPEVPEGGSLITTTYVVLMYAETLKVRDYPSGAQTGTLNKGDRVKLLYTVTLTDNSVWGYVETGWISMADYLELEYEYEVIEPEAPEET